MYQHLIAPILFLLPPERAHAFALAALRAGFAIPGIPALMRRLARPSGSDLSQELLGLHFRNPVGLAAGFDKNARHTVRLAGLGFGFIEVGSVTAQPWGGNPQPRLFRLPEDQALINRMGLNNDGAEVIARRLEQVREKIDTPVFVNVAKTPAPGLSGDLAIADFVESVTRLQHVADAIVLNVSCPNTGDGRTFQDPELFSALLKAVQTVLKPAGPPLLVKLSPEVEDGQLAELAQEAEQQKVAGFVATNTWSIRPDRLRTSGARVKEIGPGGLSGRPLHDRSIEVIRCLRRATGERLPVVGVGGVSSGAHARAFRQAGASLVELYTGFIYQGPFVARQICRGWLEG